MRTLGAILVASLAVGATACGGSSKKSTSPVNNTGGLAGPDGIKIPEVDANLCSTSGSDKRVASFDLNHDKRPDIWKVYKIRDVGGVRDEVLTCKQVDFDHDAGGRKDYVVQFNEAGNIVLEEVDFDFDGRFDVRRHYDPQTNQKILVERNTDFDPKPDFWEEYDKNEKVDRALRDRNSDGKPDYWEMYRNGEVESILYDNNFDGKVDKREDMTAPAAAGEQATPGAAPVDPPPTEKTPAPTK